MPFWCSESGTIEELQLPKKAGVETRNICVKHNGEHGRVELQFAKIAEKASWASDRKLSFSEYPIHQFSCLSGFQLRTHSKAYSYSDCALMGN